jgi:methylenetetrahydrofolate reductase (NADPH)
VDRARSQGIQLPIVAGIMPITNLNQVKRFTKMCGSKIPESLLQQLELAGGDVDEVTRIGIEHATSQCHELLQEGVPGIHFYTLNRSPATVRILRALS